MDNRNRFNLDKLNFEKNRLHRRRKLLIFSLPITAPLVVLAVLTIVFSLSITISKKAYENGDYMRADARLKPADALIIFDRTLVNYNYGNIKYRSSEFDQAEKRYTSALETANKSDECSIRINLVLALEAQSDRLVGKKEFDKAIALYDRAKSVITDGSSSCGISLVELGDIEQRSNNDGKDKGDNKTDRDDREDKKSDQEVVKEQYSRINSKLKDTKKAKTRDKVTQAQDDQAEKESQDASEPSDEAIEKLKQRSAEAQKKKPNSTRRSDYKEIVKQDDASQFKVW